jgi:hypothetical protein
MAMCRLEGYYNGLQFHPPSLKSMKVAPEPSGLGAVGCLCSDIIATDCEAGRKELPCFCPPAIPNLTKQRYTTDL